MTNKEQMRKLEKFIIINYPEFYAENLGKKSLEAIIKLIKKLEEEKKEKPKDYQELNCGSKGEVSFLKTKEPIINNININIRHGEKMSPEAKMQIAEKVAEFIKNEVRK